mgnify:CR=1 FL=1
MQELKRIINYKRIILLLIAATVNVVFFLYDNKPVMDEDIINKENVAHETYIKNYHEEVNAIIDNADKLKKYSIFNKAGSFSYANILQTARDFERVKNVILPEDEYKGVPMQTGALAEAVLTHHPETSVRGLSAESLIHLLETQLTE